MKKITFIALIAAVVIVAGCNRQVTTNEPVAEGAPETGTIVEIADGQNYTTRVGDVVYVKLTGEAGAGKQWTAVAPASGDYFLLKNHVVNGLNDQTADGMYTDEYWLKMETPGEFELQFNYGTPGKDPEKTFRAKIIVQ